MKGRFMRVLKISGPIIRARTISSLMKMNIDPSSNPYSKSKAESLALFVDADMNEFN
jgi:hypothetical protein